MLQIVLRRGEDKRVRGGHPWIFSNEIREIKGENAAGAAAEVYDSEGRFIGTGFYNPNSLISVRILAWQRADIDSALFYRERIEKALRYRRAVYPDMESFRAVYSEGDFLPGLVIDKYGEYLAVQFLTLGMERRKELIMPALLDIFTPRGIVARNDVGVRKLEGLEERVEILYGDIPGAVEVEEHGLRFRVDILGGQKTGHFFDQKNNHLLLEGISRGKDVLDCFCYTGSWGIHAALYGARSVTFVDVSERAINLARENAAFNGLATPMRFEAEDAFDRLRSLKSAGSSFDLVVLDPPAFVKSKKMLKEAEKGYLTINRRAMELLREGGYLITCSCSYHMGREMFRDLLVKAAKQAGREMRLVGAYAQALDHPVLLAVPETEYLKCFLLRAV
ncbi:MAG TPA: class I SAM-dependent rRNA methyltransferase [Geobacteraceae bacterium]